MRTRLLVLLWLFLPANLAGQAPGSFGLRCTGDRYHFPDNPFTSEGSRLPLNDGVVATLDPSGPAIILPDPVAWLGLSKLAPDLYTYEGVVDHPRWGRYELSVLLQRRSGILGVVMRQGEVSRVRLIAVCRANI